MASHLQFGAGIWMFSQFISRSVTNISSAPSSVIAMGRTAGLARHSCYAAVAGCAPQLPLYTFQPSLARPSDRPGLRLRRLS